MDEDNKIRKSLPKDTDNETKSTFIEIQKEINDIFIVVTVFGMLI